MVEVLLPAQLPSSLGLHVHPAQPLVGRFPRRVFGQEIGTRIAQRRYPLAPRIGCRCHACSLHRTTYAWPALTHSIQIFNQPSPPNSSTLYHGLAVRIKDLPSLTSYERRQRARYSEYAPATILDQSPETGTRQARHSCLFQMPWQE